MYPPPRSFWTAGHNPLMFLQRGHNTPWTQLAIPCKFPTFIVSSTDNFLVFNFVWEFFINPSQWSDYTRQIKVTRPSHELWEQGKGAFMSGEQQPNFEENLKQRQYWEQGK